MRVITGVARGRNLVTVPGSDLVRPTSQNVKEALFSSIQFDIEGRRILDLFAGCGQLGIEALSRGAKSATFVDMSETSLKVVRQNLEACGLEDSASVIRSDFEAFALRCTDKFDIAFLDPPYKAGMLEKAVCAVVPLMSDYGKIFCEHPTDVSLPAAINAFGVVKTYKYGKTAVTVYAKEAILNA